MPKTDPPADASTDAAQKERDTALRKAYGQATAALRSKRQDEFNTLYRDFASALGVQWTPRPNPEQRAAEEIDRLLAEFPNLKERFTDEAVSTDVGPDQPPMTGGL